MKACSRGGDGLGEEWGCPGAVGSCSAATASSSIPQCRCMGAGQSLQGSSPTDLELCGCSGPERGCPGLAPAWRAGAGCRGAVVAGAVPQQKRMFFLRNFKGSLKRSVQIS